ncbi:MAG: HEAT repeat domain-containing protein, partial [bacterium]|nr:HEAT repeat domain-containing protein [bacterium]
IPILKSIAAEDSEVQIRFLARKGLYHLNKRFKEEVKFHFESQSFSELIILLDDSENVEIYTNILNTVQSKYPSECRKYLLQQLSQKSSDNYRLATNLIALGKVGSSSDVEVLLNFIEHLDSRVRASVIESLGFLGVRKVLPYLIRALGDEDNRIRANAIRALKLQGRKIVFDSVKEMVKSKEIWMRSSAAYAIGEYKSVEVLEILSVLLVDKNDAVKKMAYKSLQKLAENGVVEANILLDRFESIDQEESILDYLQIIEANPIFPEDSHSLAAKDSRTRLIEINRIVQGRIRDRYKELEERLVVEEDNYVIASLILGLGQVKQESAVPLLKNFLSSSVPRLRANAIEALGRFDDPKLLPEILLNLDDSNNRARANAIIALKDLAYVDVLSPLRKMIESEDFMAQQSAFFAITEIGSEESLKILVELAESTKHEQIISNIREHILMLEESDDSKGLLRKKLHHRIDFFDSQQSSFFAPSSDSDVVEERLSTELTEVDFEGFIPDNLSPQTFDKIDVESFLKASSEIKLLMIDQMKKELTQEHYTVLRLAEKDDDFQIKCIAKIALGSYKGMKLNDQNLAEIMHAKDVDDSRTYFISDLGISRYKLKYDSENTIHELNRELQKRTQDFKKSGNWGGRFGEKLPMLSALRMDTQEMLTNMLGDEQFDIQACGLCYFSPTYKPFLKGIKSLDGVNYENFVQLSMINSMLLRESRNDYVSNLITSIAAPKYLMLLVSSTNVFLFLRYTLAYRRAEFVKFPLQLVRKVNLVSEDFFHHIAITLDEGYELVFPRIEKSNTKALLSALQSQISPEIQ